MQIIKPFFGKNRCPIFVGPEAPQKTVGWDVKRHCNAQYELHIALTGNCAVDVEAKTFSLTEGDALLIAPGQYHCPKEKSDDYTCIVFTFVIGADTVARNFFEITSPAVLTRLSEFEISLIDEIIEENQERKLLWYENINSMYFILISNIFRKLAYPVSEKSDASATYDRRFEIIDNFFEQNLAKDADEEFLAKSLNLSRRQLSRVLNEYYGMGFREKLRNARMDCAGWLLRTTNMTISSISESVGYASETSFFKAFKEHYKTTPVLYRRKMENNR